MNIAICSHYFLVYFESALNNLLEWKKDKIKTHRGNCSNELSFKVICMTSIKNKKENHNCYSVFGWVTFFLLVFHFDMDIVYVYVLCM